MDNLNDWYKYQINNGLNGQLNNLFERWIDSYSDKENAKDYFCYDGLLVKPLQEDTDNKTDINSEWERSERKIMFILKDCPNGWGYDTRELLINEKTGKEVSQLKSRFFKNIALWLYGLNFMTEENKGEISFGKIKDMSVVIDTFNKVPFVYIEGKKMAGGESCPPEKLRSALKRDSKFLTEEMEILKPNIIVCCDSKGDIFNSVAKHYFGDVAPESIWEYTYPEESFICKLHYYKEKNALLFQSFHPSDRRHADWIISERVLSPFRQFFTKYKTFDTISNL